MIWVASLGVFLCGGWAGFIVGLMVREDEVRSLRWANRQLRRNAD